MYSCHDECYLTVYELPQVQIKKLIFRSLMCLLNIYIVSIYCGKL